MCKVGEFGIFGMTPVAAPTALLSIAALTLLAPPLLAAKRPPDRPHQQAERPPGGYVPVQVRGSR